MHIVRPRPQIMSFDYETFCRLNLPDVGTSKYAQHTSCEALMAAYAFDDNEKIDQWVPAEGEPIPSDFEDALCDDRIIKWAWNANFEMYITRYVLGIDVNPRAYRDTMVVALSNSLPGKLETAAKVVDLGEDKQKERDGKRLMRKFSFPRKPTKRDLRTRVLWHESLDDWHKYLAYNRQDVVSERAVKARLFDMSEEEWELWFLDQAINDAGLPINLRMVKNAIKVYEEAIGNVPSAEVPGKGKLGRMAEITGLDNPNSLQQLLPWLKNNGYVFDDCKKGHISQSVDFFKKQPDNWSYQKWQRYLHNENLREVLELRLQTARTSIKKYYALQDATEDDGLLRNVLQMNGAQRTGRYAGRKYQPQNLPRPEWYIEDLQEEAAEAVEFLDLESIRLLFGDEFDTLASTIRGTAQAPDGMVFIDADLNAIENRVLGWLSGCQKILDVFRKNQDPYIAFAAYLYETPYEELYYEYKVEKDKSKRTIAKPGTLGAGYGMGAGGQYENKSTGEIEASGLLGYAWGMGVTNFTENDSKHSIDTFRREFHEVKSYWYALEAAAKKCVRTGRFSECQMEGGPLIRFERVGVYLKMILPSTRPLYYLRPRLEMKPTPWGESRMTLTYEGKTETGGWGRIKMTPGKVVENADQALSRDLLVHGMKLATKRGIDIRLHVHDQIVGLSPISKADRDLQILIECMEEPPYWADGLPLGSEGLITRIFKKD